MTRTTLQSIKAFLAQGVQRQTKCEACGNNFTCGASLSGCWCSQIELSEATRAELRSRHTNCLCYDCLKDFERADK